MKSFHKNHRFLPIFLFLLSTHIMQPTHASLGPARSSSDVPHASLQPVVMQLQCLVEQTTEVNKSLKDQNGIQTKRIKALEEQNGILFTQTISLNKTVEMLHQQNQKLDTQNNLLRTQNELLKKDNKKLYEQLSTYNAQQHDIQQLLQQIISHLEASRNNADKLNWLSQRALTEKFMQEFKAHYAKEEAKRKTNESTFSTRSIVLGALGAALAPVAGLPGAGLGTLLLCATSAGFMTSGLAYSSCSDKIGTPIRLDEKKMKEFLDKELRPLFEISYEQEDVEELLEKVKQQMRRNQAGLEVNFEGLHDSGTVYI